jgi:hypothetical protein
VFYESSLRCSKHIINPANVSPKGEFSVSNGYSSENARSMIAGLIVLTPRHFRRTHVTELVELYINPS